MKISDWIGFSGVILMLIAFLLNLAKIRTTESLSYILLNLIGGSLSTTAAIMIIYYPFVVLEAVWTLVSFIALISYLRKAAAPHALP